jgi:hypothetical protein
MDDKIKNLKYELHITPQMIYGQHFSVVKGHRVVGFRPPSTGELYLCPVLGDPYVAMSGEDFNAGQPRLIVVPIPKVKEYRLRPTGEVRRPRDGEWALIAGLPRVSKGQYAAEYPILSYTEVEVDG